VIGIAIHNDYGATWDEFRNRKYGQEVVKTGSKTHYNEVLGDHGYIYDGDSHAASRGPLYLIILNELEELLSEDDMYEKFKLRRLINHLFFVFTGVIFLIFLRKTFSDNRVILISSLMYFLSPRIYAHSFFNPVDIPFLCFFLFFLISFYKLVKQVDRKQLFIHIILCGIVTSLRTVGEISILITLLFLATKVFKDRKSTEESIANIKLVLVFLVGSLSIYIACTPYLWESPWKSIIEMHHQSANFGEHVPMPTFYWGKVYRSLDLPWHYTLTWLFISLPSFYVIAISVAFCKNIIFLKSLFNAHNKYKLYLFLMFGAILFSACFFKYSKYNDWRHFYFLNGLMIMLVAFTYNSLKNKVIKNSIFILFIIQFSLTAYDMYRYHPYQISFFNRISGGIQKAEGNFPLEYFGSSFKQSIYRILDAESLTNKKPIKISFHPMPPGWYNVLTFNEQLRDRIKLTHNWRHADYLATKWVFKPYNTQLLNYEPYLFDQIKIDGVSIHNIYKLKGNK
jgi:hypothetical protein